MIGAATLGPRDDRRAVLRRSGRGRPVRRARRTVTVTRIEGGVLYCTPQERNTE
ncbi:MAG: hypothetical protein ACLR8Y_07855 [Alistipes indistinctus]